MGDASGAGLVSGAGEDAGAVVVSGESEAGGGSDESVSGGGKGATSFAEPRMAGPPPEAVRPWPFDLSAFFFSASALANAGCKAASPTFLRSSSILFLACSLSVEPGC